jgi:hypothetical protein
MIFVSVCCYATHNALGIFAQPSEVGQHKVDAMHIGVGKHEPAVDEQDFIVLLNGHAVTADFA